MSTPSASSAFAATSSAATSAAAASSSASSVIDPTAKYTQQGLISQKDEDWNEAATLFTLALKTAIKQSPQHSAIPPLHLHLAESFLEDDQLENVKKNLDAFDAIGVTDSTRPLLVRSKWLRIRFHLETGKSKLASSLVDQLLKPKKGAAVQFTQDELAEYRERLIVLQEECHTLMNQRRELMVELESRGFFTHYYNGEQYDILSRLYIDSGKLSCAGCGNDLNMDNEQLRQLNAPFCSSVCVANNANRNSNGNGPSNGQIAAPSASSSSAAAPQSPIPGASVSDRPSAAAASSPSPAAKISSSIPPVVASSSSIPPSASSSHHTASSLEGSFENGETFAPGGPGVFDQSNGDGGMVFEQSGSEGIIFEKSSSLSSMKAAASQQHPAKSTSSLSSPIQQLEKMMTESSKQQQGEKSSLSFAEVASQIGSNSSSSAITLPKSSSLVSKPTLLYAPPPPQFIRGTFLHWSSDDPSLGTVQVKSSSGVLTDYNFNAPELTSPRDTLMDGSEVDVLIDKDDLVESVSCAIAIPIIPEFVRAAGKRLGLAQGWDATLNRVLILSHDWTGRSTLTLTARKVDLGRKTYVSDLSRGAIVSFRVNPDEPDIAFSVKLFTPAKEKKRKVAAASPLPAASPSSSPLSSSTSKLVSGRFIGTPHGAPDKMNFTTPQSGRFGVDKWTKSISLFNGDVTALKPGCIINVVMQLDLQSNRYKPHSIMPYDSPKLQQSNGAKVDGKSASAIQSKAASSPSPYSAVSIASSAVAIASERTLVRCVFLDWFPNDPSHAFIRINANHASKGVPEEMFKCRRGQLVKNTTQLEVLMEGYEAISGRGRPISIRLTDDVSSGSSSSSVNSPRQITASSSSSSLPHAVPKFTAQGTFLSVQQLGYENHMANFSIMIGNLKESKTAPLSVFQCQPEQLKRGTPLLIEVYIDPTTRRRVFHRITIDETAPPTS